MRINSFTPNIAFCAYKSKFSEHLESRLVAEPDLKKDLLLTNEFRDVLHNHYSKEYYMGAGAFNKVYKIDDFYILRINNCANHNNVFFERPDHTFENEMIAQLSCYYGNPIANFGDVQIMKNAIGDNDFIVAGDVMYTDKFTKRDYFKNKYLPAFATLPQKAYNNLAKDIKVLSDNGYSFDMSNPNNFIKVGNEIRVVDDISSLYNEFRFDTPMLYMFLNTDSAIKDFEPQDIKNMQTIVKKTFIAMQHAGIDWNLNEKSSLYSDVLQMVNINVTIKEIYESIKDLKDEEDINRTLDKLFSQK